MHHHHPPFGLLVLLFISAVILSVLLLPDPALQAAPVFQSSPPGPTPTATLIPTPTPTPYPDISQARKTVSRDVAVVGDVLTYTLTLTKTGPPAMVYAWEWFEPALGRFKAISYTRPANFYLSTDGLVWSTMAPSGLYTAQITYRAQVMSVPAAGVVTNTAHFLAFGGGPQVTRQAGVRVVTPTPTPTPVNPPDISRSYKMVSPQIAVVGDVLTYTVTIVNTGGPAPDVVMVDYLPPELSAARNITYTGPVSFWDYVPEYHALVGAAALPTGPVTVTLSWQATITGMPAGGVLTNTVGLWAAPQLLYPQAVTFLYTPTPTPTASPTPPATLTPTPTPTASASPTASPTSSATPLPPKKTGPPVSQPPATATRVWNPPPGWPNVLPETGER